MSRFFPRTIARGLFCAVGLTVVAAAISGASVATALGATDKRELQREVRLIIDLLQNYHYAERAFLDLEGSEIVGRFLDALDPSGTALTQADGEFLMRRFARSLKTVYLMKGDVQPAFEIFDFFAVHSQERFDWIERRLARDFDFTVDETISADAAEKPPADRAAADQRWELRLKDEIIDAIVDGRTVEEAIAAVRKYHAQRRRQIAAMDALVVRERFLETLVNLFDPHSGYFSAETAREFAVEMEGAVAGVGLDLHKEDGRCVVADVRAGGSAEARGEIMPGDHVISVADADGAQIPTATRRMRDIVALLRGEPGTSVRLVVAPAESPAAGREIVLERARVILPEERARGRMAVVPMADGRKRTVGWIDLPAFYAAGEEAKAASATRDVRELIEAMKTRGLEALVIDVRKNPGGAVAEAVALTGLFIPPATVVATRALDGTITEMKSESTSLVFGGPLVVLTSPASASASEIFAGALRYHRRALVVGGTSTYGKGTVQSYLDLEKGPSRGTGGPPWGTLRLTAQQFFFPDGASVQRNGAISHLVLSDVVDEETPREAALPHALRAETITLLHAAPVAGEFSRVSDELVADLREKLAAREAALPEFELAKQRRELLAAWRAIKNRSLVLERRRQDAAERDARILALQRARWSLAAEVVFPTEPIDTVEVNAVIAAQAAMLGPRLWPEGGSGPRRLFGHRYWYIGAQGRLGSAEVDAIPFHLFAQDATELAAAFVSASGLAFDAEALVAALRELHLLERKSDRAVRACFARRWSGGVVDEAALARGVDAVLRRAAEIDGSWLSQEPVLDVVGREAIRLASDWLDRQGDGPAPSSPAAAETAAPAP